MKQQIQPLPMPQSAVAATKDLINDLQQAIDDVAFDWMTRLLYSTDASIYQMMPLGIAFPKDADEVAAAIEIAARHGIPVIPRGGGSSLSGQSIGYGLILDTSRYMTRILEFDPAARTITAETGLCLGNMNRQIRESGLMFGPDPASAERAAIGGVIGNNTTGVHSIVYGMTSDHLVALDVVLSDGSRARFDALNGDTWANRAKRPGLEGAIYKELPNILEGVAPHIETDYPNTFRVVTGYNLRALSRDETHNLARIFAGSEGTLGMTTAATLSLVPIPAHKRLALLHFSAMRAALEATPALMESNPSAIELIDKTMLDLTRGKMEYRHLLTFVEGDPAALQIVEYTGSGEAELEAGIGRLKQALSRIGHKEPVVIISDPRQQANVWHVRTLGLGILLSKRGDHKPAAFVEDAAVPVAHLADYTLALFDVCHRSGVHDVAVYGHASGGCLHIRPILNLKSAVSLTQLREIAEGSVALVKQFGGTTSSEHGDGTVRGEFVEAVMGPRLMVAYRAIKDLFDPENRMNPGKIIDAPKMDDQRIMRYGPDYSLPLAPMHTGLDWSADYGFSGAVEMCNGAGVCRKLGTGVMCPSYMATLDEAHSTRGRANALRAAMNGHMGPDGMTSRELYQVMDLCLSCKACKSECPSSVDMAKLKTEFLHGYQKQHGVPLRSWIFARIALLNRLAQPFAPLANLLLKGPIKWVMTRLGIHPARRLPALAAQPFSAWFRRHIHQRKDDAHPLKEVVLFHDTFMEHNDPHIGKAAVRVLEAAGYRVHLAENRWCCGRPAVSKGLLTLAKRLAAHNLAQLSPLAERGLKIVGCEPSCIAMLTDEYTDLVPGAAAQAVAGAAMLIEDFIEMEATAGRFDVTFEPLAAYVLFHGHCNQKALYSTGGTHSMLSRLPGCRVEEIDSTCCGMAGSFGYESEHYEISQKLAEMKLAPAVRAAPVEAVIAATGTSCREQIFSFTGRKPLHPIEVLDLALTPSTKAEALHDH